MIEQLFHCLSIHVYIYTYIENHSFATFRHVRWEREQSSVPQYLRVIFCTHGEFMTSGSATQTSGRTHRALRSAKQWRECRKVWHTLNPRLCQCASLSTPITASFMHAFSATASVTIDRPALLPAIITNTRLRS